MSSLIAPITPVIVNKAWAGQIGGIFSKGSALVSSVALPVLACLGTLFCTLHYSGSIKSLLASHSVFAYALAHPLLVGGSFFVAGGFLYLKKIWDLRQAFPFACGSTRYKILDNTINEGDVKSIRIGVSENNQEVVISTLSEECKKKKFEIFMTPEAVIEKWQKCSLENRENGGLGLIISSKIVQNNKGREQYLVQPLYNRNNLMKAFIKDENNEVKLSTQDRIHIFSDIFNGLLALHKGGLVHADLKSENVQLDWNKRMRGFLIDTDLAQFGNASNLDQNEGYKAKKKFLGNPGSWSPELFWEDDVSTVDRFKADVWALGMIAAELFVNRPNIVDQVSDKISEIIDTVEKASKSKIKNEFKKGFLLKENLFARFNRWLEPNNMKMVDDVLAPFKDILLQMLKPNPEERLTLEQLKPLVDKTVALLG